MTITQADAELALADIRQTQARGKAAHSYREAGFSLMLWGTIWLVAYTATGLLPADDWWMAWLPGNLVGVGGTAWLYRHGSPARSPRATWSIVLAGYGFLAGLYVIVPPRTGPEAEALPALIIALLYVVLGAARLPRYAAIGALLFAATLFGYLVVPQYFPFWMAGFGGGALIVSGVWLRSA